MDSGSVPAFGDAAEDAAEEAAEGGGGGARGWVEAARRLGEKVVIAGVAAAAAPVVISSYCVASTLGFALATPFAVYLATAAATEKIMASLLPPPPSPFPFFPDLEEELDREQETTKQDEREGEPNTSDTFLEALSAASEYASAMAAEEDLNDDRDIRSPETVVAAKAPPPPFEAAERKGVINEELWALRRIIGYTGAAKTSRAEELRALYVFTGVEPPPSLRDPCNVMEIKDKLRFLKLLVGVH